MSNKNQTSMEDFFTREKANKGKKVELVKPDGTPSEHWLVVRGIDSDVFRETQIRLSREAIEELSENSDQDIEQSITKDKRLELLASLVADWSFDKTCNTQNVISFLKEAPQIEHQIDATVTRRAFFFANK